MTSQDDLTADAQPTPDPSNTSISKLLALSRQGRRKRHPCIAARTGRSLRKAVGDPDGFAIQKSLADMTRRAVKTSDRPKCSQTIRSTNWRKELLWNLRRVRRRERPY